MPETQTITIAGKKVSPITLALGGGAVLFAISLLRGGQQGEAYDESGVLREEFAQGLAGFQEDVAQQFEDFATYVQNALKPSQQDVTTPVTAPVYTTIQPSSVSQKGGSSLPAISTSLLPVYSPSASIPAYTQSEVAPAIIGAAQVVAAGVASGDQTKLGTTTTNAIANAAKAVVTNVAKAAKPKAAKPKTTTTTNAIANVAKAVATNVAKAAKPKTTTIASTVVTGAKVGTGTSLGISDATKAILANWGK